VNFHAIESTTARWVPLEGSGLEHLTVRHEDGSYIARSALFGERDGAPFAVRYMLICDGSWNVRFLDLELTDGRSLTLSATGEGEWMDVEGTPQRSLKGCIDIDLEGSPYTNTLPIRRLGLKPGESRDIGVVYVPFDSFVPRVERQRYTCLKDGRLFRYDAADGSFTAEIAVDEAGLVTAYPPLFRRIL
jgi:hypothetical protein